MWRRRRTPRARRRRAARGRVWTTQVWRRRAAHPRRRSRSAAAVHAAACASTAGAMALAAQSEVVRPSCWRGCGAAVLVVRGGSAPAAALRVHTSPHARARGRRLRWRRQRHTLHPPHALSSRACAMHPPLVLASQHPAAPSLTHASCRCHAGSCGKRCQPLRLPLLPAPLA